MSRIFADYDEQSVKMVKEYYTDLGKKAIIPQSPQEYIRGHLFGNSDKVMITANKFLRIPAKILKMNRIDAEKALHKAQQYKAFQEALQFLNSKNIPCCFVNRIGINKDHFEYSKSAQNRMKNRLSFPVISENPNLYSEDFIELLGDRYSIQYIEDLKKIPQIVYRAGRYVHEDMKSPLVNTIAGMRITTDQPLKYNRRIHVYGRCGVFGYAVEDSECMPSYLQSYLLKQGYSDICVVNHGLWGGDDNCIIHNFLLDAENFRTGDLILFYLRHFDDGVMEKLIKCGLLYYDITNEWHKYPEAGWCFYDRPGHMNRNGYRNAGKIIGDITVSAFEESKTKEISSNKRYSISTLNDYIKKTVDIKFNEDLQLYISGIIKKYPLENVENRCGAIVMNCNPFTRGHRYLIEYAAQMVDRLYIFVVEENRSFFSFNDRLTMVQSGTLDIPNVVVAPSGRFMISALTFPEYFLKDYVKEKDFDASKDLEVFARLIAPKLHITVRFAGEEPLDPVTYNYNENMRKILPSYGIEFCEIPRLQIPGTGVINATQVRKLMEQKKIDEIRKYVPDTTYQILVDKYIV